MNKYTKLGLYARHQVLSELKRMGYRIMTVGGGRDAKPEEAIHAGGITADAPTSAFRQAAANLKERGVESDYSEISESAAEDRKHGRTPETPDVKATLDKQEEAFAKAAFDEHEFHPDNPFGETRK